ncbi:GPN-loop GTPase [Vairimorpha necatrix]|uniref:GPN-loop GTPase n=1 Tax=Vairimorpha necatrix TaxID=6039 RepID=A0AAX4JGH5_9MICR
MNKNVEQDITNPNKNIEQDISNLKLSQPTIFIVVGMAGSGKTTFCQRLYSWISSDKCKIDPKSGLNKHIFSVNLDPAVVNSKMPLNLDIKDHIDYYDVMEKYNLGPNGAITTSLNLFLLNISQYMVFNSEYVIIDTPGQIESFTWSSPGYVLKDFFSKIGNVIMIYVVDSEMSQDTSVFMSNMIYSISLMCRYNIPVLCTFNKTDISKSEKIETWIRDYEKFREDLDEEKSTTPLLGSLALNFEEFYNEIETVSVSSKTGTGKDEFFKKVNEILGNNKFKYI